MEWAFLGVQIAYAYLDLLKVIFGEHHWMPGLYAFVGKVEKALESFAVAE